MKRLSLPGVALLVTAFSVAFADVPAFFGAFGSLAVPETVTGVAELAETRTTALFRLGRT